MGLKQMDKEWYIRLNGVEAGPFSIRELKRHPLFTPDTWVRKIHSFQWLLARDCQELKAAFEDEIPAQEEEEETKSLSKKKLTGEELVISYQEEPPVYYFITIILLLLLVYLYYRLDV